MFFSYKFFLFNFPIFLIAQWSFIIIKIAQSRGRFRVTWKCESQSAELPGEFSGKMTVVRGGIILHRSNKRVFAGTARRLDTTAVDSNVIIGIQCRPRRVRSDWMRFEINRICDLEQLRRSGFSVVDKQKRNITFRRAHNTRFRDYQRLAISSLPRRTKISGFFIQRENIRRMKKR